MEKSDFLLQINMTLVDTLPCNSSSLKFDGHLINMHSIKNSLYSLRFEVLIVMLLKIQVFCYMTHCCWAGTWFPFFQRICSAFIFRISGSVNIHSFRTVWPSWWWKAPWFFATLNYFFSNIVSHYREFEYMFCIVQRTDVRVD